MSTVAIIDWGIGGFALYNELRTDGAKRVIYFSDAGFTPYGKVPKNELKQRLEKVIFFVRSLGAEQISVACNAASAAMRLDEHSLKLIPGFGIKQAVAGNYKHVGVIGGELAINSGLYANPLREHGIVVTEQIAQPLSAEIEAGRLNGKVEKLLDTILLPLTKVQALILGCTHYSAVAERIQQQLPNCKLIDPSVNMGRWIKQNWPIDDGKLECYTTGDKDTMKCSALLAFGVSIDEIQRIDL